MCLFREEDDSQIRVSIRSKGRIVINRIAMELGGGGHEYAAGLALSAPLEKTVEAVIERFATDVGPAGRDNDTGFGVINPRNTLRGLGVSR